MLIVILILIIIGLIAFIIYDKTIFSSKDNSTKDREIEISETESSSNNNEVNEPGKNILILGFDQNKIVNAQYDHYSVFVDGYYGATLNQDNTVTLGVRDTNGVISNYTINNFTKSVVDIYIGCNGQDSYGSFMLFLMEDGTVEYMPIVQAINNNNIKSYGMIDGINNAVKFYNAQMSDGVVTLIQTIDGTIYDTTNYISLTPTTN